MIYRTPETLLCPTKLYSTLSLLNSQLSTFKSNFIVLHSFVRSINFLSLISCSSLVLPEIRKPSIFTTLVHSNLLSLSSVICQYPLFGSSLDITFNSLLISLPCYQVDKALVFVFSFSSVRSIQSLILPFSLISYTIG